MPKLTIYATDDKGNREEITDMYWFEESFVHSMETAEGVFSNYTFEIFVDGVKVYSSVPEA